jgi:hypothetical protein
LLWADTVAMVAMVAMANWRKGIGMALFVLSFNMHF